MYPRYEMTYGETFRYNSIEEMEQAIRDCHPETSFSDPEERDSVMALHGEDFLNAMADEWRELEYYMNPRTGTVQTIDEWREDFEHSDPDEWGGEDFEDAELVEVVQNIPGESGYEPSAGEWREA